MQWIFMRMFYVVTASEVYWSEFLTTDAGVPGSIPGHYKKKKWVWDGVHSASWVQLKSYLTVK
jgi:hypothetical protein